MKVTFNTQEPEDQPVQIDQAPLFPGIVVPSILRQGTLFYVGPATGHTPEPAKREDQPELF